MQKYASHLKEILEQAGFEVYSMSCRDSGLEGETISPKLKGPSCDPISQADYLNDCGTEFNINVGQCLGHGLIFQKYSKADVTTIVVKILKHITAAWKILNSWRYKIALLPFLIKVNTV